MYNMGKATPVVSHPLKLIHELILFSFFLKAYDHYYRSPVTTNGPHSIRVEEKGDSDFVGQ